MIYIFSYNNILYYYNIDNVYLQKIKSTYCISYDNVVNYNYR